MNFSSGEVRMAKRGVRRENAELTARVIELLPDWVNDLIRINALIADRMNLITTDFHGLQVLRTIGPMTAGELARRVGLTPGAGSRMVDRLVAADCVRRTPHSGDRRRMLIEPTQAGLDRIGEYYAELSARTERDLADFGPDELRTLIRFIEQSQVTVADELVRLTAPPS